MNQLEEIRLTRGIHLLRIKDSNKNLFIYANIQITTIFHIFHFYFIVTTHLENKFLHDLACYRQSGVLSRRINTTTALKSF